MSWEARPPPLKDQKAITQLQPGNQSSPQNTQANIESTGASGSLGWGHQCPSGGAQAPTDSAPGINT